MTPNTLRNLGLGLAMAAFVLSMFHRVAPGAIAQDLQQAFQASAAQLGNLAATYFYVYTLMQIPIGVMADTLGPRRILYWGGLVAAAGSFLFALAPTFDVAFMGRALAGLGVSVTFIAALKLIAVGFPEGRFSTMVGVLMFLGNLGAVVAGAPLAWIAQTLGWQWAFYLVGGASLLLGAGSRFWVADIRRPSHIPASHWAVDLGRIVRNRHTWPGFFLNLGLAGSLFGFNGLWAVPFLTQARGMTKSVAANHMSLIFLGVALGSFVWGSLSDRWRRRKPVLVMGCGLYLALWLVVWCADMSSRALSYPLFFCLGFFGSSFTMSWPCAKEVNPPLLSGMATGVVNVGIFLGASIMQPLFGWLIERGWDGQMADSVRIYSATNYDQGILLVLGMGSMALLACLFIRETGCRNIHDQLK